MGFGYAYSYAQTLGFGTAKNLHAKGHWERSCAFAQIAFRASSTFDWDHATSLQGFWVLFCLLLDACGTAFGFRVLRGRALGTR